jgi:methylenetetrahydrofolate--tRNA-(uracil-5-)-methyltransferase
MNEVTIVGGGLAGCEAAWQLADRGVYVRLVEMRPDTATGAHRTGDLAEIVCSNSFKSTLPDTASGLLKREMEILGCRLLGVAYEARLPAGHALGIDRELFARGVTEAIERHPRITVERRTVEDLDVPGPAVIATGPLNGAKLAHALSEHTTDDHLYFYDAIAPSLDGDTIDPGAGFWASRYGKGDDDYLNIPIDRDTYRRLVEFIRGAETAQPHAFEEERFFEACLPIEVLAARGDDTLRFGPMKPKGLIDPGTGKEPYAAIQLRQESRGGSLLGMVGFQTRMTWGAQKEFIRSIPGLESAGVLRFGSIHRNIFLNIPQVCDRYLRDRSRDDLYYAGQICGVEGYVESIMSAIVVALSIYARSPKGGMTPLPDLPRRTMIGSLMDYVHTPTDRFQPMNANMGIVPYEGRARGSRRVRRKGRNEAISAAAVRAMSTWKESNAGLFPRPDFP